MLSEAYYTTWSSLEESSPIDKFNGEEVEIVQKLSKHLKIGKVAPLGNGTSGFAYYIPNNRVLKITKDKSEAAEAFKIKGKKIKHLANIFDVFALHGRYEGTYVIISELLDKTDDLDDSEAWLENFLEDEFSYSKEFFFEDYSNGSMSPDEIKDYTKRIKEYYEPWKAERTIWFMNGMFGIINDLKQNKILSTDWGLHNIGIKKNGVLAMYDLGYGDPDVHQDVKKLALQQEVSNDSPSDYPDFFDPLFNKTLKNSPFPPVVNINDKPLREEIIEERRRVSDKTVSYIHDKIKIPDASNINSGGYGDAFASGDKIIKFTTDFKEAKFAQKFAGHKFKHIANIDNVIRYKEKTGDYIYVIVLEKLAPISEMTKQVFRAYERVNEAYNIQCERLQKMAFKQFVQNIKLDPSDPWNLKDTLKFAPQVLKMHAQMDELKNEVSGIVNPEDVDNYLSDFHFGNMGVKPDGTIAFFDLRWMTDEKHPEGVETIKETIISNEDLNKKQLPHKHPELFSQFVKEKTEDEIKEIAPSIDLSQEPAYLIKNLETNYPALFDSFADWLFENFKNQTTFN